MRFPWSLIHSSGRAPGGGDHHARQHPKTKPLFQVFVQAPPIAPRQVEEVLTLRLTREDLFDRVVMLPHAELNEAVYNAVDQFVSRYDGVKLRITILGCPINQSLQDTFREVYRAHYEDEFQKIARYLNRRYMRILLLLLISALAFYSGMFIFTDNDSQSFLQQIVSEIPVFCLWEIGYTHLDRAEATEDMRRVVRSRDAEIEFD